jgi:chemotaxis protein CheC
MELTPDEKDALTELINIGYGRAAGALSELTGYRVRLEVPSVTLHEIEVLVPMLANLIKVDVACVNQSFTGPISGNALLMMDEASAITLSRVLTDERTLSLEFDSNVREIMVEVGRRTGRYSPKSGTSS